MKIIKLICTLSFLMICINFSSWAQCPELNAVTYGPNCFGYDICFGYLDADGDGVGDNGEDAAGLTMSVADGIGAPAIANVINDGIFAFDVDDDGVTESTGYCVTVSFDNPGCDPIPYTPLVTANCPDGSPALFAQDIDGDGFIDPGNGIAITNMDILNDVFGSAGGTAIYPDVIAVATAPICPTLPDNSDAVAGFVEIFPLDLTTGAPVVDAAACATVDGVDPACDATGGDPLTVVQYAPVSDPFLSSIVGAGSFACGLDATADLSFACGPCAAPVCEGTTVFTDFDACDGVNSTITAMDETAANGDEIAYILIYASSDGTFGGISGATFAGDPLTDPNAINFGEFVGGPAGVVGDLDFLPFGVDGCDPFTAQIAFVAGSLAADGTFTPFDDGMGGSCFQTVNYTENPALTAQLVSEDPANCGDLVAALFGIDAATGLPVECAGTQMTATCAAAGDGVAPVVSFPVDPNGCYPAQDVTGTICAGCVVVCEDEIMGQVTSDDPACALAGVDVIIRDDMGNIVATLTTDAAGNYDSTPTVFPCGSYTAELDPATVPTCYTDLNGPLGPRAFTVDDDPMNTDTDGTNFNAGIAPDIPTLSEWGLITLALLLMTLGAVKMAVGSVALAGTGNKNLPLPGGHSFRLPFDMAIFRKALNVTAILAIIGFAICFAIFGAIFTPDMIGVAIAGPIFAYLAHLLYILETKNK